MEMKASAGAFWSLRKNGQRLIVNIYGSLAQQKIVACKWLSTDRPTDCWFFRHPLALAPRSHVRSLACHTDRAPCGLFIFTTPFPTLLGVVVFCYFRSVPLEIFKLPSPSPKHPASVGNRARALDPSTCVHNCYRIQAFGMNTGLPPMGSPHRRRGEIYRRR